jgi:hypothetical protein
MPVQYNNLDINKSFSQERTQIKEIKKGLIS